MKITLHTPVEQLSSVGKTTSARLKRVGIETAEDLLWNIPRTHEDMSQIVNIAQAQPGTKCTLKVVIDDIQLKKTPRKRMFITQALAHDDTGEINIVWFNQPYVAKTLQELDEVYIFGEVKDGDLLTRQINNPTYEKVRASTTHTARIVPMYHLTAGLTQKQVRFLIKQVLPLAHTVEDFIPEYIREKHNLVPLATALQSIHFPDSLPDFEIAKYRLKFNELFIILLAVAQAKQETTNTKAPRVLFQKNTVKTFVDSLPFTLTDDQKKAAWDILQDMEQKHPMNRLVQGDVGSGKTVVAALAILNAITQQHQAVLMAPTEILARQHFHTFGKLFKKQPVSAALLTRTDQLNANNGNEQLSTRKKLRARTKNGEINLLIGTHALLHEQLDFTSLALIVIDEQHRFGVQQRQKLKDTTPDLAPHFLSMTATPIPRSLALTLYGDLDISIIKQKPFGRKDIITKLIDSHLRDEAYAFVRKEIASGNQAFVICPLVAESDKLGVKAATQEYETLREIFSDLRVGLVHGKLKKADKESVMQAFKQKDIDILVATSVIEVGIDIPDATVMIIEAAERFGLAQLHQFRGRIGRSDKQSYCLLFSNSRAPDTIRRLNTLVHHASGFELAEYDLQFRGPGDVYGYRQSGLPPMNIASLADVEIAAIAKQEAAELLQKDPKLAQYKALQKKLEQNSSIHFE